MRPFSHTSRSKLGGFSINLTLFWSPILSKFVLILSIDGLFLLSGFMYMLVSITLSSIISVTIRSKFHSVVDFCTKCEQIRRKPQICSCLLKKSSAKIFTFCAVNIKMPAYYQVQLNYEVYNNNATEFYIAMSKRLERQSKIAKIIVFLYY